MTVTLYKTSDDRRVVTKTLTSIASNVTIIPKEQLDILTPRIRLAWNSAYLAANYMYISDLGRYYFISDMLLNTGHNIDIIGNVDVLMSYAAQIRALDATIIRSESVGAPTMYPDDKLPIIPNKKSVTSVIMPNSLHLNPVNSANYILTVRG